MAILFMHFVAPAATAAVAGRRRTFHYYIITYARAAVEAQHLVNYQLANNVA